MKLRRFAPVAAVVALGLAVPAAWTAGHRASGSARADTVEALEPLFQRVVVPPGEDPTALPLTVDHAQLIEIDRTGALLVHSGARVQRQEKPHAYQDTDGGRREVSVRFDIAPTGDPRLVVGSYDRTFPLVIEPQTGKD